MRTILSIVAICTFMAGSCQMEGDRGESQTETIRYFADTIGYAHKQDQMDSVMSRINRQYGRERKNILFMQNMSQKNWKIVICPHDDYSYAGEIYPYVLENLKTPTIIIFGVAHKAKNFNIEDRLVFDSFARWQGPYGPVHISPFREAMLVDLPADMVLINDSLHQVEHSVEALIPFIQYYQPSVQIVPILVPYMNFERMEQIAVPLAQTLQNITKEQQLIWGRDFSIAISNDCVHYGDQGWGGKNYAPFGTDTAGYRSATNFDMNIISECLIDRVEPQRIRRLFEYTVAIDNYKEYAWTWCGRYSVPFGLLTGYHLQNLFGNTPLEGRMLRYATSLRGKRVAVDDLGMSVTTPATMHHWVGYVAMGYREP